MNSLIWKPVINKIHFTCLNWGHKKDSTDLQQFCAQKWNVDGIQDAVEFYVFLIDFVDTALKDLGHEKRMTKILGGVFSDQKICKGCPCRYSREEQFSVISVDVKNHSNLTDSLHEYVKGTHPQNSHNNEDSIIVLLIFQGFSQVAILKQIVADQSDVLDSRLLHHFRHHNCTTVIQFKLLISSPSNQNSRFVLKNYNFGQFSFTT